MGVEGGRREGEMNEARKTEEGKFEKERGNGEEGVCENLREKGRG